MVGRDGMGRDKHVQVVGTGFLRTRKYPNFVLQHKAEKFSAGLMSCDQLEIVSTRPGDAGQNKSVRHYGKKRSLMHKSRNTVLGLGEPKTF